MSSEIPILFQDEHFFAIDKPAGYFVHPPEYSKYPVPPEKICLHRLNDHFRRPTYPVHRLDAPTTGIVLFAFTKDATRRLSRRFKEREVTKSYVAVTRGFCEPQGRIEIPLEIAGFEGTNEAETRYLTLAQVELPFAVGTKYKTARYSLVRVQPVTGRWHQIRRHFDRIAHPLLGDIEHGDSHHNRFFRDELKISGLCLRARKISFTHPWTNEGVEIIAPTDAKWSSIYHLFGGATPPSTESLFLDESPL